MPQAGIRPQEAINAQLVRQCDMLIGMFWTYVAPTTLGRDRVNVSQNLEYIRW